MGFKMQIKSRTLVTYPSFPFVALGFIFLLLKLLSMLPLFYVRTGLSFNCVYNVNNGIYRIIDYLLTSYLLNHLLTY